MLLLVGDDDVDVVAALQAVIGHAQQGVDIGGKVDTGNGGTLVDHHVEEAGVLMGKAVVILAADRRGDQQV